MRWTMFDLVIECRCLYEGRLQDLALCIIDGRIADILRTAPSESGSGEVHRIREGIVLPGIVDTHVHMRDPGLTSKEDFGTGTASAAFGGVTCVLDMPNTKPPTIDAASLQDKYEAASTKAHIDHGFYIAISDRTDVEMVTALLMDRRSAVRPAALKAFLGESTGSLRFGDTGALARWAPFLTGTGTVVAVHAEDEDQFATVRTPETDKGVLEWHARRRADVAEASSVRKALASLGPAANRLHILHISSAAGLAAAQGSKATIEVTPHHLFLDIDECKEGLEMEALCKVNPPIRGKDDKAALWRAVLDGRVRTIGSDHAPHLLAEKEEGARSPSGVPGVETMGPLVLKAVKDRRLPLERAVELLSMGPARRFSLSAKGGIRIGMDADLIEIDTSSERRIRAEDLHSRCGWTPYEGMRGIFPTRVYSRGELVVENDSLCSKGGRGRAIGY